MEFALLGFDLALVQYFLTMVSFFHLGMVMYILWQCPLGVSIFLWMGYDKGNFLKPQKRLELQNGGDILKIWKYFWNWAKFSLHYDVDKRLWDPVRESWMRYPLVNLSIWIVGLQLVELIWKGLGGIVLLEEVGHWGWT